MTEVAVTKCRSCGASICFAKTTKGKQMPLNAEPQRLVVLDDDPLDPVGLAKVAVVRACFTPHFATCPAAAEFRKSKKEGTQATSR